MSFQIEKTKNLPLAAKTGVALWALGWVWFFTSYYFWTRDAYWIAKMTAGVGLLTLFMVQANNWSRMIALMVAAIAILYLSFFAYGFYGGQNYSDSIIAIANMFLFGAAGYYFIDKATVAYFKMYSPSSSRQVGDQPPEEHKR
jgi:hypothetical protein